MKPYFNFAYVGVAVALGISSLSPPAAHAQSSKKVRELGIGAIFGEPTGITAKYWRDPKQAIDFGMAYSFDGFLLLYSDYLFHFPALVNQSYAGPGARDVHPYLGIGGLLYISTRDKVSKSRSLGTRDSNTGIGVRLPLGIEWTPKQTPLGIFLEIVPGLGLIPGTYGFLQGGLGIRYYLK